MADYKLNGRIILLCEKVLCGCVCAVFVIIETDAMFFK